MKSKAGKKIELMEELAERAKAKGYSKKAMEIIGSMVISEKTVVKGYNVIKKLKLAIKNVEKFDKEDDCILALVKKLSTIKGKENIKKVFVAFYDSTGGMLKSRRLESLQNLKHSKDYKVFLLEYVLNSGDISNVPFSNAEIYEELCFGNVGEEYWRVQKTIEDIKFYNKKATIELFVSVNRANELCNLYFFANVFKDMDDVYLNYYHEESEEVYIKNIGKVTDSKIVVDKRELLTTELIVGFEEKWQKLALNNKAVRECCGGEIKEYSLQEAQEKILPVFRKTFRRFNRLYVDFLEKCDADATFDFSYNVFEYVTKKLIDDGIVERTYNTDVQSGCADIYFEQDFRLK